MVATGIGSPNAQITKGEARGYVQLGPVWSPVRLFVLLPKLNHAYLMCFVIALKHEPQGSDPRGSFKTGRSQNFPSLYPLIGCSRNGTCPNSLSSTDYMWHGPCPAVSGRRAMFDGRICSLVGQVLTWPHLSRGSFSMMPSHSSPTGCL